MMMAARQLHDEARKWSSKVRNCYMCILGKKKFMLDQFGPLSVASMQRIVLDRPNSKNIAVGGGIGNLYIFRVNYRYNWLLMNHRMIDDRMLIITPL